MLPFMQAAYISTGMLICDPTALQVPYWPPLPLMIFACQLSEAVNGGEWNPLPKPERSVPKSVFVTQQ